MATLKDVAKEAGVSATTVSIIINGKAEQRKIPPATCQKVRAAIEKLGYQPDPSARLLRSGGKRKPLIGFFWPQGYRLIIMASFINSMAQELQRQGAEYELVVHTFENDRLSDSATELEENVYDAVIVGACSAGDLAFLESLRLELPLVLINRHSEVYSSVEIDNVGMGRAAAEMIFRKGYRSAAAVTSSERYLQTQRRTDAFLARCKELGIEIRPEHCLSAPRSMAGGAEVAVRFATLEERPGVLFFESASMALGTLNTFHRLGISVPEDVEILALSMIAQENTMYSVPSLSILALPNRKIGEEAIRLLLEFAREKPAQPIRKTLEYDVYLRDSFRLPSV